ncbi:MAG: type I-U CRISPR-associated helicase/endonuclease Cas3 [Micropruina sp.]|uniref:type I-G CRISPR-associated helicase/endonuclease Cas3g n=1 Tax=Micropruina sp. TaxID=2737536 RepID=UPI0039E61D96
MIDVQASDFSAFYQEIHRREPFAWQRDLVTEVVSRRCWPSLVDVPTGLGKTSMLDIAVFLSALDADAPHDQRVGRRRIFFVVDRRIVVDQAERHARTIVRGLEAAEPGSVASQVAARLRTMAGQSGNILPIVKMRGGVTWDGSWLARPDQPGIVTGTVDQVGSRLFFRGYGVSPRRWPIDAALVGMDSLILVDEAHLATALTTTLAAARSYDTPTKPIALPPATVVQLTATARDIGTGWIPAFDEPAHLSDPVAARRLKAAKTLQLRVVAKSAAVKTLVNEAVAEADAPAARVLVVCNTIDRARAVHTELAKSLPESAELLLLIGRSRQYDREAVVARALELFEAGRDRTPAPAVLVATQTVEVGIDLDASSLVTESASWDALVQRIGRVNRRGDQDGASIIVVHDDDPKPPVYGQARLRTADFIGRLADEDDGLDVSPLALRGITQPSDALSAMPDTPFLLPAHLDAWARTGPAPVNDAPVDPYLHGLDHGVAPVSLAWRDGLLHPDRTPIDRGSANLAINSIPVRAEECVDVPLSAVRRWLSGEKQVPISDWDDDEDWEIPFGDDVDAVVLRYETQPDGTARWQWVRPGSLRPGDLVVVPSELGGLDRYGWSPSAKDRVQDVAELAALDRGQPVLRLDEGLPRRLGLPLPDPNVWESVARWRTTDDPDTKADLETACGKQLQSWLSNAEPVSDSPWDRRDAAQADTRRTRLIDAMTNATMQAAVFKGKGNSDGEQYFSEPVAILRPEKSSAPWQEASEDTDDGTAHLLTTVTLRTHGAAVRKRAEEIARFLQSPPELTAIIGDAAGWHDIGKVDPRFQAMLFEGDPVRAAIASEPLAKSGMPPGDLQRHRDARRRSGLPPRARHEAWSHALVAAYLAASERPLLVDPDLLLHLVASHHGHARPLLPPVVDGAEHRLLTDIDGTVVEADLPRQVDLSHAERFQALNWRYGWWGLALLEAIVRCADMTVSGEGS